MRCSVHVWEINEYGGFCEDSVVECQCYDAYDRAQALRKGTAIFNRIKERTGRGDFCQVWREDGSVVRGVTGIDKTTIAAGVADCVRMPIPADGHVALIADDATLEPATCHGTPDRKAVYCTIRVMARFEEEVEGIDWGLLG